MSGRALKLAGCLAAILAIAAAGGALASFHDSAPRPVFVGDHGLTLRSSTGSFCTQSRPNGQGVSSGMCADSAYPLRTHGHLPVAGGDVIHLRFRHNPAILDRVKRARVALLKVDGKDIKPAARVPAAVQNPEHPSRWTARLPRNLHGANVIDVSVIYNGGDGDFWAAITPRG